MFGVKQILYGLDDSALEETSKQIHEFTAQSCLFAVARRSALHVTDIDSHVNFQTKKDVDRIISFKDTLTNMINDVVLIRSLAT